MPIVHYKNKQNTTSISGIGTIFANIRNRSNVKDPLKRQGITKWR